jgi:hypothetical protein
MGSRHMSQSDKTWLDMPLVGAANPVIIFDFGISSGE